MVNEKAAELLKRFQIPEESEYDFNYSDDKDDIYMCLVSYTGKTGYNKIDWFYDNIS